MPKGEKNQQETMKPYPGFPETPCPVCGGSTKEPWRRYPYCKLCNPENEDA